LSARADFVKQVLDRLAFTGRAEFACLQFARDAVTDRVAALDARVLHAFDLVYTTPKLLHMPAAAVAEFQLTGTLAVTLLSRPVTCTAVLQAIKKPAAVVDLLPAVYSLVHASNAAACLQMMSPQQLLCLYLHHPSDAAVGRAVAAGPRQVADAHLDVVAKLAAVAQEPDPLQRVGLVCALTTKPAIIVRGERFLILSVGFCRLGVLELTCSAEFAKPAAAAVGAFKVTFLAGVDRRLIDAVAFIHWTRACHVFRSMTVLPDGRAFLLVPCAARMQELLPPTHVYSVVNGSLEESSGPPPGPSRSAVLAARLSTTGMTAATAKALADPGATASGVVAAANADLVAAGFGTVVGPAMWGLLRVSEAKSVMLQCVALTFKQTAEQADVQLDKVQFFLDDNEHLFVYATRAGTEGVAEAKGDADAYGPSCGRQPAHIMVQGAMDKVRTDSTQLMTQSREYVHWAMALLTGAQVSGTTAPLRPFYF
jgi:hypothetical protein